MVMPRLLKISGAETRFKLAAFLQSKDFKFDN